MRFFKDFIVISIVVPTKFIYWILNQAFLQSNNGRKCNITTDDDGGDK